MHQQAQLLNIILDPKDVVYTPDWVAADMVSFFQPSGSILEPSKGEGVFLKYLPPETDWCEIAEGRDFFRYTKNVDWIIGNPPFKQFDKFLLHSFSVAVNVVYLIPADKPFNALPRARMIAKNGGIVHMRYYVDGPQMEMPDIHRPMAAFHFQRGYSGAMGFSFAVPCLTSREPRRGGFSPATGIIHPEAEPTAPALSAPTPRGLR